MTLTSAATEYSLELAGTVKAIEFQARTSAAVRFAYATGKVATPTAPYMTLKADSSYGRSKLYLNNTTLYFGTATAGTVVEVTVWR